MGLERPLAIEILTAEIVERNALTAILEAEREAELEAWGEQVERTLGSEDFRRGPHLHGLTLLVAQAASEARPAQVKAAARSRWRS